MSRKWLTFSIVGAVSLAADLLTKIWAKSALPGAEHLPNGAVRPAPAVSVIDNFWDWQLSFNRGSAFSMFTGQRAFLTIVGLVALIAIGVMIYRAAEDQKLHHWSLGLIAGGAIGNLGERIFLGEVTDFIVWRYYDARWPTFNIADVVLVVGVVILLIDSFRPSTRARQAEEAEQKRKARAAKRKPA